MFDLSIEDAAGRRDGGGIVAGQAHEMDGIADRCERIAELVGDHGQEGVFAAGLLSAQFQGLVEVLQKRIGLAVAAEHQFEGGQRFAEELGGALAEDGVLRGRGGVRQHRGQGLGVDDAEDGDPLAAGQGAPPQLVGMRQPRFLRIGQIVPKRGRIIDRQFLGGLRHGTSPR